jgi:hypothetical protein
MPPEGFQNGTNDSSQSAPPPGVNRRNDFAFRIVKEDGYAVRRLHHQRNAGLTGQDAVTGGTLRRSISDYLQMVSVNLVHGNHVAQTEPVQQFSLIRTKPAAKAEGLAASDITPTVAKREAMGHLHVLEGTTNQQIEFVFTVDVKIGFHLHAGHPNMTSQCLSECT